MWNKSSASAPARSLPGQWRRRGGESFPISLSVAVMNQAPHPVLEGRTLCLQKLGLLRRGHLHNCHWGGMHGSVMRAHRAENANLRAPATTPTPTFPSPDQMDRSPRRVGRDSPITTKSGQNHSIHPGSSRHGLHYLSGSQKQQPKTLRLWGDARSASQDGPRVTQAVISPPHTQTPLCFWVTTEKQGLAWVGSKSELRVPSSFPYWQTRCKQSL